MRLDDYEDCFVAGKVGCVRSGKEFNGDIASVRGDKGFKEMLMEGLYISETHSWLVVHYRKEDAVEAQACDILLNEIVGVYALDSVARGRIMDTLDDRVCLRAPIWSEEYDMLTLARMADIDDMKERGKMSVLRGVVFGGDIYERDAYEAINELLKGKYIKSGYSWVLVHYKRTGWDGNAFCEVSKEETVGIYSLDEKARECFKEKNEEEYACIPWPALFREHQLAQQVCMAKRGIESAFRVFGLNDADLEECRQYFKEDSLLEEVCREVLDDERPKGKQPVWVYVLRYDRHLPYFQDTRGCFQDASHALASAASYRELTEGLSESSPGMKELNEQDEQATYDSLRELPIWYYVKISANKRGVDVPEKYFQIAPLFFKLSQLFRESGLDVNKEVDGIHFRSYVNLCRKYECLPEAVYLLGAQLGNNKTYDAFYDTVGLCIFYQTKGYEKSQPVQQTVLSKGNIDISKSARSNKGNKGKNAAPTPSEPELPLGDK